MNTTIRVRCPDCGETTITDEDIGVICLNTQWSYHFLCPHCLLRASTPCSRKIVDLITNSTGVTPRWVSVPLELYEPKDGAPITDDDVYDFLLDLYHWNGNVV